MNFLAIQPAYWQTGEHGELFAPLYGDIYASRSSAWGQAQAVFIEGCELPMRAPDLPCIRLLEAGFGLGVNFLATWTWLRQTASRSRLWYIAVEKHPFTAEDLRTALKISIPSAPVAMVRELQALAEKLLAAWPPLIPGFHTIALDDQVTLTLALGDIGQMLASVQGTFDAFYLEVEKLLSTFPVESRSADLSDILGNAIALNRVLVSQPFLETDVSVQSRHNIIEYWRGICEGQPVPLVKGDYVYQVFRTRSKYDDFQKWCREVVWWGNKKGAYLFPVSADTGASRFPATSELAGHY